MRLSVRYQTLILFASTYSLYNVPSFLILIFCQLILRTLTQYMYIINLSPIFFFLKYHFFCIIYCTFRLWVSFLFWVQIPYKSFLLVQNLSLTQLNLNGKSLLYCQLVAQFCNENQWAKIKQERKYTCIYRYM